MKNRIEYLDGHRGLAILLVILFHAYARWPALVPYGNEYAGLPFFKLGWLGVELFFLISGFVILMTLEKCKAIGEFLYRRWLRLFPAMLICSFLIYCSAPWFFERPAGPPTFASLLPGLTFIEPTWWGRAIRQPIEPLEGAFWSIFVEFKFYVFAALLFYWKGRRFLIGALLCAFALSIVSEQASRYAGGGALLVLRSVAKNMSFEYFGWFASGACFYVFSRENATRWFVLGCLAALASSAALSSMGLQAFLGGCVLSALFAASLVSAVVRSILNSRVLQLLGFVSYPLYLIHENMMISLIIKISGANVGFPPALVPVVVVTLLCGLAYVIAKYAEPATKRALTGSLRGLRRSAHAISTGPDA